jgi:hypothetical protein
MNKWTSVSLSALLVGQMASVVALRDLTKRADLHQDQMSDLREVIRKSAPCNTRPVSEPEQKSAEHAKIAAPYWAARLSICEAMGDEASILCMRQMNAEMERELVLMRCAGDRHSWNPDCVVAEHRYGETL